MGGDLEAIHEIRRPPVADPVLVRTAVLGSG